MLEVLIGVAIVGGIIYLNKKGKAEKQSTRQYPNGYNRAGADSFSHGQTGRPAGRPIPQPNPRRRPAGTPGAGANTGIRNGAQSARRVRPRRVINAIGTHLADYGWRFIPASTMATYSNATDFINDTNRQKGAHNINATLDGVAGGVLVSAAYAVGQAGNADSYAPEHDAGNGSGNAGFTPAGAASAAVGAAPSAAGSIAGGASANAGKNPLGVPSPGRHIGINRAGHSAGANAPGSNGPYPNGRPAPQYQQPGSYSGESHYGRYILGGLAAGALMYGIFGHHGDTINNYGNPYGHDGYGGYGGPGMMDPNMNPMPLGANGRPEGVAEAAALDGNEEAFSPNGYDSVSDAATGASTADYLYGDADTEDYDDDADYDDDTDYGDGYDNNDSYGYDADEEANTDSYYGDDNSYSNADYDEDNNAANNAYYGDDNSYNNADYDDNDDGSDSSYYDGSDDYGDTADNDYSDDNNDSYDNGYSDNSYDSDYSDNDDSSYGGWFDSSDSSSDDSSWFSDSGSDGGGFFDGGGGDFFDGGGGDW